MDGDERNGLRGLGLGIDFTDGYMNGVDGQVER